jgi:hypothetical protein
MIEIATRYNDFIRSLRINASKMWMEDLSFYAKYVGILYPTERNRY